MNPFIGQIMPCAFNFAPKGWAFCDGQLLPIPQNAALFSLLGTMYGGNGTTTFALPDLQGRTAIHFGQGPGLSLYVQGQTAGSENITLLSSEIPAHAHTLSGSTLDASQTAPSGSLLPAVGGAYGPAAPTKPTTLDASAAPLTGGSQPHNNLQPLLVCNFIIALQGVYPARP